MILSIQDIASQLTVPDSHIPTVGTSKIDPKELEDMVRLFRSVVFNGYFDTEPVCETLAQLNVAIAIQTARIYKMLQYSIEEADALGTQVAQKILTRLPELRRRLGTDVQAMFDSDPAAKSREEVILCYPSLVAMIHYRLAHELLLLEVPILPRLIMEAAHSTTGIDIHPGAQIGDYFSIDHGTGVVIGETCIIGNHVRIYQGVTLGAKSIKFDADGNVINEPRHPILEDGVVVYSNSSILGRVRIGHDSVIGGNIWQTTDVPPKSRVLQSRATVEKE